MADFYIRQGDTVPIIVATLQDANGVVDLTNATSVAFHMANPGTARVKTLGTCDIIDLREGKVSYAWTATDTDTAGLWSGEFKVTWGDGTIERFPNDHNIVIQILTSLA